MLILPILVSIGFDVYGNYLVASGSWSIIIGFLYPIVALLVSFATFGLLIHTRSLFRVAFAVTALTLIACLSFVWFIHGVDRTNIMSTTFIFGIAAPAALGVAIMLELDNVVRSDAGLSKYISILNRTWIFYFAAGYANWNIRYFTIQIEDQLMRRSIDLGLDFLHVVGYFALIVSYLYVINKTNLKPLWKIPQTS